jgi:hypothetical protein
MNGDGREWEWRNGVGMEEREWNGDGKGEMGMRMEEPEWGNRNGEDRGWESGNGDGDERR